MPCNIKVCESQSTGREHSKYQIGSFEARAAQAAVDTNMLRSCRSSSNTTQSSTVQLSHTSPTLRRLFVAKHENTHQRGGNSCASTHLGLELLYVVIHRSHCTWAADWMPASTDNKSVLYRHLVIKAYRACICSYSCTLRLQFRGVCGGLSGALPVIKMSPWLANLSPLDNPGQAMASLQNKEGVGKWST